MLQTYGRSMLIAAALIICGIVVGNLLGAPENDERKARAERMRDIDNNRLHYLKLVDGHTISMRVYPSFETTTMYTQSDRYISPKPCIVAEVSRQLRGTSMENVEDALLDSYDAVIEQTYKCVKRLKNVEIENLEIEYRDIVDLGRNFTLPKPSPEPPYPRPTQNVDEDQG